LQTLQLTDNGNHFDFPLSLSSSYRLLVDSLAKAAILFDKLDSSNNWGDLITKYPELRDSSGKLITSGEVCCVLYTLLYMQLRMMMMMIIVC